MRQALHSFARTAQAVRRAIQHSQEILQSIAQRHGINSKTVVKWRKRPATQDVPMRPNPASTMLTPKEEAAVAFR